ncbi:unnamed protein product [Effrenium voratum]|uniref:Uncharacterized protein n=1 Tax=Effrenium voratum TaxID=2562239 RepID=A0AA36NJM7_9DINO|nr:unnamed protein product [Effrenium voratum]
MLRILLVSFAALWADGAAEAACSRALLQQKTGLDQLNVIEDVKAGSGRAASDAACRTLVVHVGPWKTGTTSLQSFLVKEAKWLEQELDVLVALKGDEKSNAYLPFTILRKTGQLNQSDCPHCVDDAVFASRVEHIASLLSRPSAGVILSAEDLSLLSGKEWAMFKDLFANTSVCTRFLPVVSMRSPTSWYQSLWIEYNKLGVPQSFMQFLSSFRFGGRSRDEFGDADTQLAVLNQLQLAFGPPVAASYDQLLEQNVSTAAFLICNATLGRQGEAWERCRDALASKALSVENVSPPPAALDVVRLAFNLYNSRQRPCNASFGLRATQVPVIEVAAQMPLLCGSLDAFFVPELDKWYQETKAQAPSGRGTVHCSVDERAMTPSHWRSIRDLVPCTGDKTKTHEDS